MTSDSRELTDSRVKREKKEASEKEVPGYVTLRPSPRDNLTLEERLYFSRVYSERSRQHFWILVHDDNW